MHLNNLRRPAELDANLVQDRHQRLIIEGALLFLGRLTGAHSVFEALAWAEANAGPNRTFTLYVATIGRSLIRLAGTDPTATPEPLEG